MYRLQRYRGSWWKAVEAAWVTGVRPASMPAAAAAVADQRNLQDRGKIERAVTGLASGGTGGDPRDLFNYTGLIRSGLLRGI